MMGPRQEAQPALFYEFSLEDHVSQDHLLRSIDRFVDLSSIRAHLASFYSHTGRPSVDPELPWPTSVQRVETYGRRDLAADVDPNAARVGAIWFR